MCRMTAAETGRGRPGQDVVGDTARTYDRIVESYERSNSAPAPEFLALRAGFVAALPPAGRVLDLGCGPGRDLAHFVGAGLRAVGVDASVGMVRRASGRGLPAVVGDLRRPPAGEGVLDGIWSAASLLHVPRRQVPDTLAAWRAALRTGGRLGLTTSVGGDEGWEAVPYAPDKASYDVPLRRWYVHHRWPQLRGLLADAGFDVQQVGTRQSHRAWVELLARAADR